MPSRAGRLALVRVGGTPTTFTGEATTTSDNKNYRITAATKRVWSRTDTVTVLDDGVETVEDYTINRLTGTVTFATVDALRGPITVTGKYLPMATAAKVRAYGWSLSSGGLDDTSFDSDGWTERQGGIIDLSGTLGRRFQTGSSVFRSAVRSGDALVLEFYSDRGQACDLRCWARFTKDAAQAATDALVENDLEFQGAADVDGRVATLP